MLKIGLTGGIGCGKTTVANMFADRSVPFIDADAIAHAVVEPYKPALTEIINQFGRGVVSETGQLNRQKLRDIVFDAPEQKKNSNPSFIPWYLRK